MIARVFHASGDFSEEVDGALVGVIRFLFACWLTYYSPFRGWF